MPRQSDSKTVNSAAENGFLYVLSNPTMPGLIKLGKTNRDPSDRVRELSSATGVPTPFVLIYSQRTTDCTAAERWAHQELEHRGYRMNASREFFSCPVHEAVEIVLAAHSATSSQSRQMADGENLMLDESSIAIRGEELYMLALQFYVGEDTTLPNPRKALKLFEQASEVGHAQAASLAASIYSHGVGSVRADPERSLGYLKIAVGRGVWSDIASIAMLFQSVGRQESAEKYWTMFFEHACSLLEDDESSLEEVQEIVAAKAFWYFLSCYEHTLKLVVPPMKIAPFGKAIASYFVSKVQAQNDISTHRRYQLAINFVHSSLNISIEI